VECDTLVRLSAVRAVGVETAADAFVAAHLQYDEIRRIAIRSAMERMDYPLAETLCRGEVKNRAECEHPKSAVYATRPLAA
jgi:hypothetical protein